MMAIHSWIHSLLPVCIYLSLTYLCHFEFHDVIHSQIRSPGCCLTIEGLDLIAGERHLLIIPELAIQTLHHVHIRQWNK